MFITFFFTGQVDIGVRGREAGGGGATALPNSDKTVGKIWAKREKIMCEISGKSTPLPPLTEESPYAHASGLILLSTIGLL